MAIKEIKREWSPCQLDYVKTFLLHSEADVKDLPKCCIGSKATVSETDNEYFCTADGWKLGSELGGGQTVILEETEVLQGEEGGGFITTPLTGDVTAGDVVNIIYNDINYECTGADASALAPGAIAFGNLDAMDLPGGNVEAPFVIFLIPGGMGGVYGMVDGVLPATITITKMGGSSGSSSTPSDTMIVTATLDLSTTAVSDVSATYEEVYAAARTRKELRLYFDVTGQESEAYLVLRITQIVNATVVFGAVAFDGARWTAKYTPDGLIFGS